MLQAPLRKLRLGQGVKGGIRNPLDDPSPLPKLNPNIPHIQAPKAPPINYGAVAQQRRLPAVTRPGISPAMAKQFASSPRLSAATPEQSRQMKLQTKQEKLGIGKYKPLEAGFLPTSTHYGGLTGWTQNLLTEVGHTAIGVGPGLYHVGGGLIHHPLKTTADLSTAFAHSVGQTIHHPLRQLEQDPLGFITNVLMPIGVTAGTAARVAELSRTATALRTGEITKLQAIAKVGKTLVRPQPMKRSIGLGKVPAKIMTLYHGGPAHLTGGKLSAKLGRGDRDFYGGNGIYSTSSPDVAGTYAMRHEHPFVHQLKVGAHTIADADAPLTPEMRTALSPHIELKAGDTLGSVMKRVSQSPSEGLKNLVKPVGAAESPHMGNIQTALDKIGAHGMHFKPLTSAADVKNVLSALGKEGDVAKTQAALKGSRESLLWNPDQAAAAAGHTFDGFRIQPPAFKSALGGYLHTKLVDPLTEKAVASTRLKGVGQKVTALGREFRMPSTMEGLTPSGHLGKLIRRQTEADMQMSRGLEEQKILEHMKPGGALHGMEPEKAQALAYGRGAAKAHLRLWHNLYEGGAGADETIASNPTAYVGIRKDPPQVKWKNYRGDAGIARQFQSMVETDPAKLAADPHAYSYIPRGTWQRMKLYEPGRGHLASAFDAIDRGTQMIRIGRFLHPGYAAWAAQNGILHLSQAGPFIFRNAWQLRHEYSRLMPDEKAVLDNSVGAGHFGGGIARATQGSGRFSGVSRKLGGFWHKVDDQYWRRMSLIHELNHAGYHSAEDWAHLIRTDMPRFRAIAMKAQDQAINYSEMSPAERATLQKLFTAWGWTRGASTYTMRFPLEHPVQARALEQIGQGGSQHVENFYAGKNGMVPNWLRGFLPIGHSDHPFLAEGDLINPGGTFGNLIGEIPGATKGQTESLSQEEAPVPAAIQEIISGTDRYGNALKPGKRLTQPLGDLAKRFEPYGALQTALTSKKGGGTLKQGPLEGLERFGSIPLSQLNDAQKTAALGMKDYEQALSRPDQIDFRYNNSVHRLRREAQLFHRHGADVSSYMIGKVKGDLEAVHTRDLYQYHYASAHGANSYRSLPATNKVHAAIAFLAQHHYIDPGEVSMYTEMAKNFKTDAELERMASELWHSTGIGGISNSWANSVKRLQPSPLTPARG